MKTSEFKLQLYNLERFQGNKQVFCEDDGNGKWVRWKEVEPLLKAYLALMRQGK